MNGIVTAFVDQVARERAQKALEEIGAHERLCLERYDNIHDTLTTIKRILGWAGAAIFSLLMATLGWLVVQQFNRNDDDKAFLRTQIELLQQQARPTTGSTAR